MTTNDKDQETSELIASLLLKIGAVNISIAKPFTYTSGIISPVYIDCRKIISHPEVRGEIIKKAAEKLKDLDILALAGGETAGIPYAAFLASNLNLPMLYVRKKPKGFGRNLRIEGDLDFVKSNAKKSNQEVVLVEDLSTNGQSKIDFCLALREAGLKVCNAIVVFNYDIFNQSTKLFDENQLKLIQLTSFDYIIQVAKNENLLTNGEINELQNFYANPNTWAKRKGFAKD